MKVPINRSITDINKNPVDMTADVDNRLGSIYEYLLAKYGRQGWWPLIHYQGCNPTKSGIVSGYHPGKYTIPESEDEKYEICLGAILTQNTGWPQVEVALKNLVRICALNPASIKKMQMDELKEAIKPSGYYNQKAKKVKIFTDYFMTLKQGYIPRRDELLTIWGIGRETADSMLLYAFKVPTFVVDAYTKRIMNNLKMIEPTYTYDQIKEIFEKNLPRDLVLYQEYHALIVEHAKRYYPKKADYTECPLYQSIVLNQVQLTA
ncbi:MAG: endonuclease III domain-containing protein [bacterium]